MVNISFFFSDASELAYGECSYTGMVNETGRVHCSLLLKMSRVATEKLILISRLELNATVLPAKMHIY